jgi:diguanylate cyclase
MQGSLVADATRQARRSIALVFVLTGVIVAALIFERLIFERVFNNVQTTSQMVREIAGRILLADEQLTMSARMAAATGNPAWVDRYNSKISEIDAAIQDGLRIATPEIAKKFDSETRVANDKLVGLERQSFKIGQAGDLALAMKLLDGAEYAESKAILARGTANFSDALISSAEQQTSNVRTRAQAFLFLLAALSLAACAGLWKALRKNLTTSETEYVNAEQRLKFSAMNDELTGLPNRRSFYDAVSGVLSTGAGNTCLVMLDIDNFKDVNDTLGHQAGDDLICSVAKRLKRHLPKGSTLARLGGDELAVVAAADEAERVQQLISGIEAAFAEPFVLLGQQLDIKVSAGVAQAPEHCKSRSELMRLADIALYRAKEEGRNRIRYFSSNMDQTIRERRSIANDLREAIASDQLTLHYQPLMAGDGEKIVGIEALARWEHPSRGTIAPGQFVALAEETGMIGDLGEWVMRRAFTDAHRWKDLYIAINVSAKEFRSPLFIERVRRIVAETGVDPNRIELEVTESLMLEDNDRVRATLRVLKHMGFNIVLDDFGTGYSSLSYLRNFAFSKLKIDRSFTASIESSNEAAQIIHSVVQLGRALQMTVTAEGVETAAQHRFLRAAGCQQLQGYLFSRPASADTIDALLGIAASGQKNTG